MVDSMVAICLIIVLVSNGAGGRERGKNGDFSDGAEKSGEMERRTKFIVSRTLTFEISCRFPKRTFNFIARKEQNWFIVNY